MSREEIEGRIYLHACGGAVVVAVSGEDLRVAFGHDLIEVLKLLQHNAGAAQAAALIPRQIATERQARAEIETDQIA